MSLNCTPNKCDELQERMAIMEHDGGFTGRLLKLEAIRNTCGVCDKRPKFLRNVLKELD